jgi:hypothetical protein
MEHTKPIFELSSPLSEQVWYRDWDHAVSLIESLKIYLFDHGTIPVWNMHFCGGRPELSLPHGLSFLWHAPFVYGLPSYVALFAIWIVMTLIGGGAFYLLLKRWTGDSFGAAAGAILYCASGYYASHYNQGHIWWASHHFFTVFLLFFDKALHSNKSKKKTLAGIFIGTWCFFTASLPHGLFYLYPAFLLYVLIEIIVFSKNKNSSSAGLSAVKKAFIAPIVAHGLGIAASMYKLIPVIAWQRSSPRQGVLTESMDPVDIIFNSLRFVSDFYEMFAMHFDNQVWFAWEYSWYVGLGPWLLFLIVFIAAIRSRNTDLKPIPSFRLLFAILLVTAGILLAMGNGNHFSPSYYFKHFPLINGIRTFGRYQVLCLLGLSIISAFGIAYLRSQIKRTWIFYLFILATVGPGLVQTGVMVARIGSASHAMIEETLKVPKAEKPGVMAVQGFSLEKGMTYHTYLLRKGYWILDCYDPMNFKRPKASEGPLTSITSPGPESVELTWRGAKFQYPEGISGKIVLNAPVYEGFTANIPYKVNADDKWEFDASDLKDKKIEIKAPVTVELTGFGISFFAALLGLVLLMRYKDAA